MVRRLAESLVAFTVGYTFGCLVTATIIEVMKGL